MQKIIKTLLIGGSGFIGGHMVPLLKATGRDVSIVGRSALTKLELQSQAKYFQGDFHSLEFMKPLLESHDEIVLLAYASVPNTSHIDPLMDLKENLTPTVQLFIEMAKLQKKLILVSSGGTIYGEQHQEKIKENHNKRPISSYGITKTTLENYAFLYGVTDNLNFTIVRPSNAYGIGQIPFTGQGFIAAAIASAKMNKKITIFGESGTVRDYLYVTDLAKGIVDVMTKGKSGTAYNIGSSIGYTNLDIFYKLNCILKKYNTALEADHLPSRRFDVRSNILDISKIRKHTGWEPLIEIDQGLALAVADVFEPKV